MALWNVSHNGEEEIMYSEGSLGLPGSLSGAWGKRHYYEVPYTNVGKGGIATINGTTYHTPSWIEVHPDTTPDDILVIKQPFEELFVEVKQETWSFKSATSDKEYTVKRGKNGLHCDCWGYIAHRKCKHLKEVRDEIGEAI